MVWTSGPVPVRRRVNLQNVQPGTRMVSCPWQVTTSINTTGWPEGLYYLVLTGGAGRDHMIPLVVESASVVGKTVLVFNDCTMQAYNQWGGYSPYTGPTHVRTDRSYKVSFDRPYRDFDEVDRRNAPLIRAAEAITDTELNLAYTTEARISGNPQLVTGAAAVIFSAHSRYWSPALRRAVEEHQGRGRPTLSFSARTTSIGVLAGAFLHGGGPCVGLLPERPDWILTASATPMPRPRGGASRSPIRNRR